MSAPPRTRSRRGRPRAHAAVDADIAVLNEHKREWAQLPPATKAQHLRLLAKHTAEEAERWVRAACDAKGIAFDSPLAGEEWSSGPWALLISLNRLTSTLEDIVALGTPRLSTRAVHTRAGGQVVVDVFPQTRWDRLLLSGVSAEVWMQPGVTAESLAGSMAVFYKQPDPPGAVALVLGAGNIAAIAPLDVVYKLFAEGSVVLLKLNPVNQYLGPIFEAIFADLISAGFVRLAYGGAEVGEYLTRHEGIDAVHVTGSARTHDAIVFGSDDQATERKAQGEPASRKRMTSELGNVSPTIVVPGPWTPRDLRFQAAHVATQKLHNAGFNCIAAQVLVTHPRWRLTEAVPRGRARCAGRGASPTGVLPGRGGAPAASGEIARRRRRPRR